MTGGVWVGADPGGKGAFGLAVLESDGTARTRCVDCADAAVAEIAKLGLQLGSVLGLGVDAPLWWSSGPSGGRKADQWLRRTYGLSGGEVQAANSLRGAALVQGVLFVARMREHRPGVRATEAHPKALLKALRLETWDSIAETLSVLAPEPTTEHERDAVVAAIAAREGFEGRWTHDLSRDRNPSEQDPDAYWLAPVRHYWPEE